MENLLEIIWMRYRKESALVTPCWGHRVVDRFSFLSLLLPCEQERGPVVAGWRWLSGGSGEWEVNYGGVLLFRWLSSDGMVGPDMGSDFSWSHVLFCLWKMFSWCWLLVLQYNVSDMFKNSSGYVATHLANINLATWAEDLVNSGILGWGLSFLVSGLCEWMRFFQYPRDAVTDVMDVKYIYHVISLVFVGGCGLWLSVDIL